MAFNFKDYFAGKQGLVPDWNNQSTKEMIGGKDYAAGKEGYIPDSWTGGTPTKEALTPDYMTQGEGLIPDSLTGGVPTKQALDVYGQEVANQIPYANAFGNKTGLLSAVNRETFDPSDPDQVLNAQKMLNRMGYTGAGGEALSEDSMMGKNTEHAWRSYIAAQKQAAGEDKYSYDENVTPSKGLFGGLFGRAYQDLDKKIGVVLPGGYVKDQSAVQYSPEGQKSDASEPGMVSKAWDWLSRPQP